MVAQMIRAAAIAALTSAVGYAMLAYRNHRALKQQEKQDKVALQEWETDGGGNVGASSPNSGTQTRAM